MSKKIILADDNRTFLMYLGLLLKRFGYKVIPAENGLEVLKLVKLIESDVVMLDVHMQMLDGISVLRHIKGDKRIAHTPVIMVSSDSSRETIEQCKVNGCFDYLLKPIKIDQLHASLQLCFFSHMGTNRKHIRTFFNKKVFVDCAGQTFEFFSETLSEGGVYLRKEEPFPVGTELCVVLPLQNGQKLTLKGEVIYIKKLFGDYLTLPPGMAVQFKHIAEKDSQLLRGHIENLIAEDILEGQGEKIIEK
jgi:CheY-like chemotaxis protein